MEVILLENVGRLGGLGDKVNVKAGYGRNFLVPFGKAVPATKSNIESFEVRRAELEKIAAEKLSVAQARAETLNVLELTIVAKSGDEGKLFGSIGARDIADTINAAGVEVDKNEVRLPEGAIRTLGNFEIDVQIHSAVTATIKLAVVAE